MEKRASHTFGIYRNNSARPEMPDKNAAKTFESKWTQKGTEDFFSEAVVSAMFPHVNAPKRRQADFFPEKTGSAKKKRTNPATQGVKDFFPETPRIPKMAQLVQPTTQLPLKGLLGRFDEVKTNLRNRLVTDGIKTIFFAGTAKSEGASTSAIGLAASLAQDHQKQVLLVDANFHRPYLHEVFGIGNHNHLFSIATQRRAYAPFARRKQTGNLYVIPGAVQVTDALNFFESKHFDLFLKTVRKSFDFIVFDGPTITGSSEAKILAAKVDGVIMVIESSKTRRQVAIKAKRELIDTGATLLGVILNKRRHFIPKWIYNRL
jgi:protein-tyrosine kinase